MIDFAHNHFELFGLPVQFRIDDASTNYYAKGLAGMSFDINGTQTGGPLGQPSTVTDGRIAYAGGEVTEDGEVDVHRAGGMGKRPKSL